MIDLQKIKNLRLNMSEEQKKKLLVGLKRLAEEQKKKLIVGLKNPDINIRENEYTARMSKERNVIAKEFDTEADYDSYIKQRRGLEITQKELQSVLGYTNATPVASDKYYIKYESGDDFGNNETSVIKKMKEGNIFCWVAFIKYEDAKTVAKLKEALPVKNSNPSPTPSAKPPTNPTPSKPSATKSLGSKTPPQMNQSNAAQPTPPKEEEKPPIRIVKSITFNNDTEGANILSDFIRKLDL